MSLQDALNLFVQNNFKNLVEEYNTNLLPLIVSEYTSRIVKECEVDRETLETIWDGVLKTYKLDTNERKETKVESPKKAGRKSGTNPDRCVYRFIRKGMRLCDKPCVGTHCSAHKKHALKEEKEEKKVPKAQSKPKIVLERHKKLNLFLHKESGFLFDTNSAEKIVTGKLVGEKKERLTKADIKKCQEKYHFKFSASNECSDEDEPPKEESEDDIEEVLKEVEDTDE